VARFFPRFDLDRCRDPHVRLILRNMLPVGVFVCTDAGGGLAEVELDYVVPEYRDLRNAHFVYTSGHRELRDAGLHTFVATTDVPVHQRYLRRFGFRPDPDAPSRFTRPV